MVQKNKALELLKRLYLFVFILALVLVAPTHIFPPPSFAYLRFPTHLEIMQPFLGISWPASFKIYHFATFTLTAIGGFNILGLLFYPKLRKISLFSSLLGMFLISLAIIFFLFPFMKVNASTAIVYGLFFMCLLGVDVLTFFILTRSK